MCEDEIRSTQQLQTFNNSLILAHPAVAFASCSLHVFKSAADVNNSASTYNVDGSVRRSLCSAFGISVVDIDDDDGNSDLVHRSLCALRRHEHW